MKNKIIEDNPEMKAANERLKQKELEERVNAITSMNRHQRRAFAKRNGLDKIRGTRTDHIK